MAAAWFCSGRAAITAGSVGGMMTAIPEMIDLQAGKTPGLLGVVLRWLRSGFAWSRKVLVWLKRDKARVWLRRKAVAVWMNVLILAAAGIRSEERRVGRGGICLRLLY